MKQILQIWRAIYESIRNWLLERKHREEEEVSQRGLAFAVSLLISFMLWFTASLQKSYTVTLDVPVQIVKLPPNRALETLPPSIVRVQFQGQGWQLLKIYYHLPPLTLEIREENPESIDLLEAVNNLDLPPTVRAINAFPRYLTLKLAPRITRVLPIRFRGILEPAPLYDFVEPPRLDPDSATVSGARAIVQPLRYWPTAFIVRRNIRSDLKLLIPLSDTLKGLVERTPDATTLYVRVALFTEGIREIPIRILGAPPDVQIRLSPPTLRVVYRVPLEQFDAAQQAEDFYAYVRYADIQADTTGTVRPHIHLPEGVIIRDLQFEPRRLRYFLVITESR